MPHPHQLSIQRQLESVGYRGFGAFCVCCVCIAIRLWTRALAETLFFKPSSSDLRKYPPGRRGTRRSRSVSSCTNPVLLRHCELCDARRSLLRRLWLWGPRPCCGAHVRPRLWPRRRRKLGTWLLRLSNREDSTRTSRRSGEIRV